MLLLFLFLHIQYSLAATSYTHVCVLLPSILQFHSILVALIVFNIIFSSLINFRWFRLAYSVFFIVLEAGKLQKNRSIKSSALLYALEMETICYDVTRYTAVCGELLTTHTHRHSRRLIWLIMCARL